MSCCCLASFVSQSTGLATLKYEVASVVGMGRSSPFYGDYLVAPVEMMSPFNSSVSSKKVYAGKLVMCYQRLEV